MYRRWDPSFFPHLVQVFTEKDDGHTLVGGKNNFGNKESGERRGEGGLGVRSLSDM